MTDLTPELQAELVEFVRYAGKSNNEDCPFCRRARKLAAKLPPLPDPDIEEARKVVDASPIATWDRWAEPSHNLFLSLLKRGRELERSGK